MDSRIGRIKNGWVKIAAPLALLLSLCSAYAAEVENIEKAEIPAGLEKAIELKKEGEFKIIPLVDITALGTFSKVSGGSELGGVNTKGSIAPVLRFDEKNYLIPLYYGSYNRERQVVVEEEGGRVYNEVMDHNLTLEYKHIMDEQIIFRIDGLTRLHYVKEEGYKWSKGLYDYEDLGVGGSIEYFLLKTSAEKRSVSIGGEFYQRLYPNYKSLISLATVTAPEADEKDYLGYRPVLKYKYASNKLNCAFLYSPLYKDYQDKKVIDSNGVLMDEEREDWFHYTNLNLSYLLEGTPIALGLGITGILVDSNQNYYDSKGTVTLGDDIFTSNYYSFKSLNLNPRLTYIHKIEGKKNPATFTLGYAFLIRDYDDRKAQEVGGVYTTDTQLDKSHTISLQAVYPLTQQVSIVGTGNYTKATSNMDYQTYYRYKYESVFLGGGLRIKY